MEVSFIHYLKLSHNIENIQLFSPYVFRIEEILREELNLAEDEMLIPVAHFCKDVFSVFGIPFFLKVKQVSFQKNLK